MIMNMNYPTQKSSPNIKYEMKLYIVIIFQWFETSFLLFDLKILNYMSIKAKNRILFSFIITTVFYELE